MTAPKLIKIGKIVGVFGVKGWVKVFSYTAQKEHIFGYAPWLLVKGGVERTLAVADAAVHGKSLIALPEGVGSPEQAAPLVGGDLYTEARRLPQTADGEYYWSELIGLNVQNLDGALLGTVSGLMETGANDVLLVNGDRQRAIPFLQGRTVLHIDLKAGQMTVDWDVDF